MEIQDMDEIIGDLLKDKALWEQRPVKIMFKMIALDNYVKLIREENKEKAYEWFQIYKESTYIVKPGRQVYVFTLLCMLAYTLLSAKYPYRKYELHIAYTMYGSMLYIQYEDILITPEKYNVQKDEHEKVCDAKQIMNADMYFSNFIPDIRGLKDHFNTKSVDTSPYIDDALLPEKDIYGIISSIPGLNPNLIPSMVASIEAYKIYTGIQFILKSYPLAKC